MRHVTEWHTFSAAPGRVLNGIFDRGFLIDKTSGRKTLFERHQFDKQKYFVKVLSLTDRYPAEGAACTASSTAGQWHALIGCHGKNLQAVPRSNALLWPTPQASDAL